MGFFHGLSNSLVSMQVKLVRTTITWLHCYSLEGSILLSA